MFDTSLRDQSVRAQRAQLEQERVQLMACVTAALQRICADSLVREAYITGSLTQPERWDRGSDIDVAVGGCAAGILEVMRVLEVATSRPVDVIDLDRHPHPDAVRRRGVRING